MDLTIAADYFLVSPTGAESSLLSIPAVDLLHQHQAREFLEKSSAIIKGIGLELAVSNVGLSIFGLAATQLFVMSQYNRVLDLTPSNLTIQLQPRGAHIRITFIITELKWTELPVMDRTASVLAEWKSCFSTIVNPLIEAVSNAAGLGTSLIWNQYGARLISIMNFLSTVIPEGPARKYLEEDHSQLIGLPATTFNLQRKNPFEHTPCYIDSPYQNGKQTMIRSACCMHYRREGGVKCYSCPILKEEDRAAMKLKIEEAARQEQGA